MHYETIIIIIIIIIPSDSEWNMGLQRNISTMSYSLLSISGVSTAVHSLLSPPHTVSSMSVMDANPIRHFPLGLHSSDGLRRDVIRRPLKRISNPFPFSSIYWLSSRFLIGSPPEFLVANSFWMASHLIFSMKLAKTDADESLQPDRIALLDAQCGFLTHMKELIWHWCWKFKSCCLC